jgi:predicted alpha/beta superfamily hydrolase
MRLGSCAAAALLFASSGALAQGDSGRASPAAALTIGDTFTIESKTLGEVRRINVYLPPAYADSTNLRLPVLYLPDGGIGEDFLHVAGLVEVSVGNGTMRPFLLVGIENTQRRRDLTGSTENPSDKKIAPHVGGSASFRDFIRSELMPLVNARYRTTDETAVMGESLAGLFVVETLFADPDLFDTYIAFDPSLWWNNKALATRTGLPSFAAGHHPKTLYLASSNEKELALLTKRLAERLREGAPPTLSVYYDPMPGETHATIYRPAALKAVRRLFKPVSDPQR